MAGVGWSVSARLANRLVDFVTLIILARALSPADFGLIALATTLVVVVETVLEIALAQALTRLPRIDKSHLDTAFTLSLLRGAAFALTVAIAAWPFAAFYNDDRLLLLILVLAWGPLARGLLSPAMVLFTRQLSFREAFFIQTLSKLIAAGIAFVILFAGGGYWAIAVNSIAAAVGATLLSYVIAPYRPVLSLTHFKEFSGFLGWLSFAQMVSAINWQFDRILLGSFIGKADLGRYTMASDLATLPTQSLIGPAMQPLMAAFSRIIDDPDRLQNAFLKAERFTMMLAMPACIAISLMADDLVTILLSDEWKETAPYLQWLALTTLLNAYFQPLHSLAIAMNRTKAVFRLNAFELICRLVLLTIGFLLLSVWGVIAARGLLCVIMFFAAAIYARSFVGTRITIQLRNLWEICVACLLMAGAMFAASQYVLGLPLPGLIKFSCIAVVGGSTYALALLALGVRMPALSSVRQ